MTKKEIKERIKAIKKELKYAEKRDKVCCCFYGNMQVYELTQELYMLEDELEGM